MRDLYPGFHEPTDEEIRHLWEHATVVLDTNVLLNLYRYPERASRALLDLLDHIHERLWLPHHVGLEYQWHRPRIIAEQVKTFSEVKTRIKKSIKDLSAKLAQLQLETRHPTIDPSNLLDGLERSVSEFLESLDLQRDQHVADRRDDPIRAEIERIFAGRVGDPFQTQDQLEQIYKGGEARYSRGSPPGYSDAPKRDGPDREFEYQGLVYRREFGDLIIWEQILAHAVGNDLTELIFITDDQKGDWWWTLDVEGPRRLGPRPELVAELASRTSVKVFWIYTSERFLELAGEFLDFQVSEDSITQVKGVLAAEHHHTSSAPYGARVELLNPPHGQVTTQNNSLTFDIQGRVTAPTVDLRGDGIQVELPLDSIRITLRDPTTSGGVEVCKITDALIPLVGAGGNAVGNDTDVFNPIDPSARAGFTRQFTLVHPGVEKEQHVCFSVEAAQVVSGVRTVVSESAWTTISWRLPERRR